jgi:zinc D-Ala-D-Ala dipeptidase
MRITCAFFLLINGCFLHTCAMGSSSSTIPKEFIYLDEAIPSIRIMASYAGSDNFMGRPVNGYESNRLVLTKVAADSLKKAQKHFQNDGYSIVVYDAYRPQRAADDFMRWRVDLTDQKMKAQYYPRIDKEKVLELGYVADKSAHSRGSTVDISIILQDQPFYSLYANERKLEDGFKILFLDDGTVDMGSSFDLFDIVSHTNSSLITTEQQRNRSYLKETMERFGFKNYEKEWWHFSLTEEPFPQTYFDFVISNEKDKS